MNHFVRAASLRVKFTAVFVAIVVGGTIVSTALGTRIITRALHSQARARVRYGLEVAHTAYQERLDGVQASLSGIASSASVLDAAHSHDAARLAEALERSREARRLDFLSYVEARTGKISASRTVAGAPASRPPPVVVREAFADHGLAWSEVVLTAGLPRAEALGHESSLALVATVPVKHDGVVTGALYGGVLLSGNRDIVDRVKRLVFGGEQYRGRDVGSVAIFVEQVRVAGVIDGADTAAFPTRASPDAAEAVLRGGRSWHGRVLDAGEWHVAAYEPIRDRADQVVGMLYVGLLEAPLLAVRTNVMLTFYAVALIGVIVVLGLTYVIVGNMIRPLEQMVNATRKIAAGDLDLSVQVGSRDEIGHLAVSFNTMVRSLRTMNAELQSGARTLEQKVRERTEELAAVQARMAQSEKLASIGRLAAGVAHEINNPLAGILSLAMLGLEDREPGDPMRADLEVIVKQTLRCREIVKGLLDFSRESESRATPTQIDPVIENTLALLERQSIFQNVRIVKKLQGDVPPVLIDSGQLQEVVMNIVINAVDAMEETGELTVETEVDRDANEVAIRIADTGKGIPDEVLPFIFEPFFTTKKVGEGTGLGLSIVHGIVTRAGGRIEVKTSPRGTTFTVRLPISVAEALGPVAAQAS